jgi:hypothetical protein
VTSAAQFEMFPAPAPTVSAKAATYPRRPGFKARGPSEEAARRVAGEASRLRTAVLVELRQSPNGRTADEIAASLRRSILSVRPRVSELHADGKIEPSEERRRNESGHSATVWIVSPAWRAR